MVSTRQPTRLRTAGATLGVALAYVALGRLGLELAHVQTNATLVWPPTGLSIAALVLFGPRLWPGVALGALIVNLSVGTPPWVAVLIAGGNTLEAVIGAWLLRLAGFRPELDRLRDVLVFAATGIAASVVSASVATLTLSVAGRLDGAPPEVLWLEWWLGDVGGAAVVAPLLFVWARGAPSWRALARRGDVWMMAALIVLTAIFTFSGLLPESWLERLLGYAAFPLLIYAGLRTGPRGAVTAAAAVGAIAVVGTALARGPFSAVGDPHHGLLLLWAYVTSLGLAAAILAAAVAERDAAERARVAAHAQAERASSLEALGVLAGGVAHDFNNLLTVIQGNTDLARMVGPDDDTLEQPLEQIETASTRAAALCQQLLDYAGGSRRQPRALSLGALVEDTARLVRGSVPRTIALKVSVEPALPLARVDEAQVQQVAMNLVLNARDAIGEREGRIEIHVRALEADAKLLEGCVLGSGRRPGTYLAIEVRDDGAGMDPETLARVFDPFFTTKGLGRGLGLASTLGIARAHQGAVRVESAPDRGTTFAVLLPASDASEEEAPLARTADVSHGTILVADDQPAVLDVVVRTLEAAGWRVFSASDGREAVDVFEAHQGDIDAVFLDVDMPRLDGVGALKRLRALAPDLPIVIASGKGVPAGLGTAQFLSKPFDHRRLHEALAKACA